MKKVIKMSRLLISLFIFVCSLSIVLASNSVKNTVPFRYNIIAETKVNSIIDKKAQKELEFHLFQFDNDIYYNGKPVNVKEDKFSIDITDLKGKSSVIFKNSKNETVTFNYYIADENGFVEDYELVPNEKLNTFVTTYNGVQIIYTEKETQAEKLIEKYLSELPKDILENLKTIKMIPFENTSNIAGVTKENTITLYKFSKYVKQTQKQILFHEIAHTWANKLMQNKIIDYSYREYSKAVKKDNKEVSNYSSKFAKENNRFSEDFADSVAFYFISASFKNNYPNRAQYISELLNK